MYFLQTYIWADELIIFWQSYTVLLTDGPEHTGDAIGNDNERPKKTAYHERRVSGEVKSIYKDNKSVKKIRREKEEFINKHTLTEDNGSDKSKSSKSSKKTHFTIDEKRIEKTHPKKRNGKPKKKTILRTMMKTVFR